MEEKILLSIKKMIGGVPEEDTIFDDDILQLGINPAFMTLMQLGLGPEKGFICDATTTWSEYAGERLDIEGLKQYLYFKTRMAFDPPQNSFLVNSMKEQISELEWRLCLQAEEEV